jgi:hypothetical protein
MLALQQTFSKNIVCKTTIRYNPLVKICTVCGLSKDPSDYFYRNKHSEKLHAQCKQCYLEKRRLKWKEYYYKHGSKYRENATIRNRKLKNKLRSQMLEYLSDKSCLNCGISDVRVLDFDHIDPLTKSFSIARAIADITSWDKILIEIDKCQILCANCHKIKTAQEQNWYRK